MTDDIIPLPRLARELRQAGLCDGPISYDRILRGAMGALFPVDQAHNGRYSIRRVDLAAVADALRTRPVATHAA